MGAGTPMLCTARLSLVLRTEYCAPAWCYVHTYLISSTNNDAKCDLWMDVPTLHH